MKLANKNTVKQKVTHAKKNMLSDNKNLFFPFFYLNSLYGVIKGAQLLNKDKIISQHKSSCDVL